MFAPVKSIGKAEPTETSALSVLSAFLGCQDDIPCQASGSNPAAGRPSLHGSMFLPIPQQPLYPTLDRRHHHLRDNLQHNLDRNHGVLPPEHRDQKHIQPHLNIFQRFQLSRGSNRLPVLSNRDKCPEFGGLSMACASGCTQ